MGEAKQTEIRNGDSERQGPYQHELRRPGAEGSLREREEVAGRAFDRPEPTGVEAHGAAAIAKIADTFQYPLSREDLLACAGDQTFEVRRGEPVLLRDAMVRVSARSFETCEALVEAVVRALEERGDREEQRPAP